MNRFARTILASSLTYSLGVWADTCPEDSYKLATQAQVDALGAKGCDKVVGNLEIIDSDEIYNLEPLAPIDEIQGALTISGNTALLNLDGLVNVATAASVSVDGNTILTNVDGLRGLRQVGSLSISGNPMLRDVEGLSRLVTVTGDVILDSNPRLQNLAGFNRLISVDGSLSIHENLALLTTDGLSSLTRVGGDFSIQENPALLDVNGLSSLTRIGRDFSIQENVSLLNIDGLSGLIRVGSSITIKGNSALKSIEGLSSLVALTSVTVSASASEGGSISPASQQVFPGLSAQFSLVADPGFYASGVGGTCPSGSLSGATYTTGEISADCTVIASFTSIPTFTVTASSGVGGSISPPSQSVEEGGTASFTITLDDGFSVSSNSFGGTCPRGMASASKYVTGEIVEDCSVVVSFFSDNPADYCSDVPEGVVCDPSADGRVNPGGTMDSWGEKTWGFENTPIPYGKVVAYPFLANGGASNAEGIMEFSNNMPDLSASDYAWKGWFSATPGGAVLNDNDSYCRKYSPNPNPLQMKWSQASAPSRYRCELGTAERVLYFNMEVACYAELAPENCTVGEPFPGVGDSQAYYIKVYPR